MRLIYGYGAGELLGACQALSCGRIMNTWLVVLASDLQEFPGENMFNPVIPPIHGGNRLFPVMQRFQLMRVFPVLGVVFGVRFVLR